MGESDLAPPAPADVSGSVPVVEGSTRTVSRPASPWGPVRTVAFRFVFFFLALSLFPFPLGALPGTQGVDDAWDLASKKAVLWAAREFFPVAKDAAVRFSGGGDSLADWLKWAACLGLSALGAAVWTAAARKRGKSYPRMAGLLWVGTRYYLAFELLGYGFSKLFPRQFPPLAETQLVERVGDASPMGLLWTFMGYSQPYVIFAGAMELLPAVLLCFRRTALLGGLAATAVMANVVAMNFCFDVPVKLYSTFLLLLAIWTVAQDAPRMVTFLSGRAIQAAPDRLFDWPRPWMRVAVATAQAVLVGGTGAWTGYEAWKLYGQVEAQLQAEPLRGIYEVESFALDGIERPALLGDAIRWRSFIVAWYGSYVIELMDGTKVWSRNTARETSSTLSLASFDGAARGQLAYALPDREHLTLQGTWKDKPVKIALKRVDPNSFLLMSRGFRWVSDAPFNR